jgi:hypothetical protein
MPRSSISTSSCIAGSVASCSSCARGVRNPIRAGSEAGHGGSYRRRAEAEDEWFVDNFIRTINIGASLEDATWDLALRVLPQAWWDRRTAELAAPLGLLAPYRLQNGAFNVGADGLPDYQADV